MPSTESTQRPGPSIASVRSGKLESVSISFRPLSVGDLPKLADWLAAPHVKKWWPESHDLASIECRYLSIIQGPDATEGFIILTEGCPVGYIQRYRLVDEPEWRRTVSVAVDGL